MYQRNLIPWRYLFFIWKLSVENSTLIYCKKFLLMLCKIVLLYHVDLSNSSYWTQMYWIQWMFSITVISKKCILLETHINWLGLSKKINLICFNESLSKVMKNPFYFTLQALFGPKLFKFLSWWFWSCRKTA